MKKIIISLVFGAAIFSGRASAQQPAAIQLANRIADKMKDTLGLNEGKRNQVFAVNLRLYNQKRMARQSITNTDSLRRAFQIIENRRDSLYSQILPPPKYSLYLQKKTRLVNAN